MYAKNIFFYLQLWRDFLSQNIVYIFLLHFQSYLATFYFINFYVKHRANAFFYNICKFSFIFSFLSPCFSVFHLFSPAFDYKNCLRDWFHFTFTKKSFNYDVSYFRVEDVCSCVTFLRQKSQTPILHSLLFEIVLSMPPASHHLWTTSNKKLQQMLSTAVAEAAKS